MDIAKIADSVTIAAIFFLALLVFVFGPLYLIWKHGTKKHLIVLVSLVLFQAIGNYLMHTNTNNTSGFIFKVAENLYNFSNGILIPVLFLISICLLVVGIYKSLRRGLGKIYYLWSFTIILGILYYWFIILMLSKGQYF